MNVNKSVSALKKELAYAIAPVLGVNTGGKPVDLFRRLNVAGFFWFASRLAWCKLEREL